MQKIFFLNISRLLLIMMFTTVSAGGVHTDTMILYMNFNQQPKAWLDTSGEPHGFAYDVARAVLEEANIEFAVVGVPFPRGLKNTQDCRGMMTGVFKTAKRQQYLLYSKPIMPDEAMLVMASKRPFAFNQLSDLKGKKFTYLRSASFGSAFEAALPDLQGHTHLEPSSMLKMLVRGRVDAVILNPGRAAVEVAAKKANLSMDNFKIADVALSKEENYLVVCKKNSAKFARIIERVDLAIERLQKSGRIEHIMAKY
ncbi:MAG: hypothetical protein OFPII_25550 [Osedax symbiont Rs1]|nr:MAG: hypothetical protein OFPII_25550 [Osedax symbiont Rs1]